MRLFLLKGMSLAVSVGTLAYIVAQAAANSGCSASSPRGQPQSARSEVTMVAAEPPAAPPPTSTCAPVYMMPATKAAPVFRPDECNPYGVRPHGKAQPAQSQAIQQAP
jgi:hypothetical protein